MVNAFATENDVPVPYPLVERRSGDVVVCYADATRGRKELNWKAEMSLTQNFERPPGKRYPAFMIDYYS
jgi:UDP-glucose 4-epimerase